MGGGMGGSGLKGKAQENLAYQKETCLFCYFSENND